MVIDVANGGHFYECSKELSLLRKKLARQYGSHALGIMDPETEFLPIFGGNQNVGLFLILSSNLKFY